ncbi:MAG: helix-turn-helix transcriptional regulator [Paramuribaculum sp.]|nr:helix-turn-helix transcriptional regulator [Paramuribaculum sp.]
MENTKTRRIRKVSSWMTEAARSIKNEEEILAGKKIVLKVLRYMEANHMSQKQLAEKLDVSPQYINKFLHGQDCDIKISTAIRYGKILNLKLIEIPD